VATYRRRSSSFLITHSTPARLHCVHSLLPGGTTQRMRRSRHWAHATEALCLGLGGFPFVCWDEEFSLAFLSSCLVWSTEEGES